MWGLVGAVSLPGVAAVAGQTATTGFDPYQLITAGVTPVAVLIAIMLGKLAPEYVVKEMRTDKDHAEAQVEVLTAQMSEKVIPALTLSTQVLDRLAPMMQTEITFRADRQIRTDLSDRREVRRDERQNTRDERRDEARRDREDEHDDHDRAGG